MTTQVRIDENDIAFKNTTKSLDPFYLKEESKELDGRTIDGIF
ncbi:MAG: hypothetical protein U9O87_04010 [Verrucomicrobiota bacterium]|nr:hypothetical protein [Verrucomicrobiota bacterium]